MKRLIFYFLMMLSPCTVVASTSAIPMKKASVVWWPEQIDTVLTENNSLRLLKDKLEKRGYQLATQDINVPENSELILVAYPGYHVSQNMREKSFLWLLESPITLKLPLNPKIESRYKKIFTYDQELAKNDKYVLIPIPYSYSPVSFKKSDLASKNVLVAQVAGFFKHGNPKNNYNERDIAVKWFLKNHPKDILFAGRGKWDTHFRKSLPPVQQSLFDQRYKGEIKDKIEFLRQAKFGLAYENAVALDYVTEKIYDVMIAGTVPVYQGAPNIEDYVPKECFINRNDFESYDELYDFLKNMPEQTYLKYINCIAEFMTDTQKKPNSIEAVSDQLVHEMLDDDSMTNGK